MSNDYHNDVDDEADELASTSLLDALDSRSDMSSTRHNSMRSDSVRTKENLDSRQTFAKPLSPLPLKLRPKELIKDHVKRPVLGTKSTNLRVADKKGKLPAKPKISPPVLVLSSMDPSAGQMDTNPNATTATAYSDNKFVALQQQADTYEAETREKEKRLAAIEASTRPSPLQRGKSVLTTAKRAIASRLQSPKIKFGKPKNPFNHTISGPEYRAVDEHSKNNTRILPVYESMRTRRETPEPKEEHDPFSDAMEANEAWSDLEIEFDRRKDGHSSCRNINSSQTSLAGVVNTYQDSKLDVRPKSPTGFSNKISGLRQHPNTEFFSSSPVGFSTPRVRLEPRCDSNGKKRLSAVVVRDPSVMDFSFEEDVTDDEADPLIRSEKDLEQGSSVKRKSATEDLRADTSKRAKTELANSGKTTVLAKSSDQLGTSDGQATRSVEATSEVQLTLANMCRNKGFGIFNIGNGQDTSTVVDRSTDVSSICRHSRQHSSSQSRPTSVLFSRESRARVPLLQSHKDDEMDIDELQMDDP